MHAAKMWNTRQKQADSRLLQDRRYGIALWVYSSIVQGICSSGYTQEPGTLLKGLGSHLGNLHKRFPIRECSFFRTEVNNILSQYRPYSGYIR